MPKKRGKPYIIKETSTKKYIDVVAPSKRSAIGFIGDKGIYDNTSARSSANQWGVYIFRRN